LDYGLKLRIFHGPVNIAGIGRYLADWQREQGMIADSFSLYDSKIVERAHFEFFEYGWLICQLLRGPLLVLSLFRYNVFHLYFGISLLPFNLDLPILKLFGKRVVMTYCGSDIRLIDIETTRNPYAGLLKFGLNDPRFDPRKKLQMRWHRLWVDQVIAPRNLYASACAVFPKAEVEKDLWLHNTMDVHAYAPPAFETKDVPLLVHAPSKPGIKGTEYVKVAIEELRRRGMRFEFLLLEDRPHAEVQRILRDDADIVLDQFLLGGFGTFAVEGMYYGKPVVGYLIESVRAEHYPDCPIANATIDDLADKLGWLIANPKERMRIGREGREFVERHFDRDKVGHQVLELYRRVWTGHSRCSKHQDER
jgi:glycosyltransferase involved in cell wall biosynthesis